MNKLRFATAWLGGCSGCHMSFLDLDEKLIDLADKIECWSTAPSPTSRSSRNTWT
jgi:coenzyme F420-reducing hydrogenase gamma subunit